MLTRRHFTLAGIAAATTTTSTTFALAEDRAVINTRVNLALDTLWRQVPSARKVANRARAMLVMPDVVKGGLIVGGAYGEGALLMATGGGSFAQPSEYFSVAAASIGFQVGVQTSSHVLMFMTEAGLQGFRRADGWEVGADAEVTFPESGLNAQLNSTLLEKPIIGYVFGQDGFLAGVSLEGAKYSRIQR